MNQNLESDLNYLNEFEAYHSEVIQELNFHESIFFFHLQKNHLEILTNICLTQIQIQLNYDKKVIAKSVLEENHPQDCHCNFLQITNNLTFAIIYWFCC